MLLSRRRNLSQLKLEQTDNEYPSNSFWERQWVIFDGSFSTEFLEESLYAISNANYKFIQEENNILSRFQYLIWNEKQSLEKELLSFFKSKSGEGSFWTGSNPEFFGSLESNVNSYEKTSSIISKSLQKLETTRFFFETRKLSNICPKSLSCFKIVYFRVPVFNHEDLIKTRFKRFALLAEENLSPKLMNLFNSNNYHEKLSTLVKNLKEQIIKKSFLKDKTLFNIKLKDSLIIFEHILLKILTESNKSLDLWNGRKE